MGVNLIDIFGLVINADPRKEEKGEIVPKRIGGEQEVREGIIVTDIRDKSRSVDGG